MRELSLNEIESVSGGYNSWIAAGGQGLMKYIPQIVDGAVSCNPVKMTEGIVGTALSGAAIVSGVVYPIVYSCLHPCPCPPYPCA